MAMLLNILFTYLWIVGITNAINLLDNMDGLAGGIALVAALILSYFFWREGNIEFLLITVALTGSLIGFLIHNFPPASIFMGNSGSTFLGFTLAGLAILGKWSNTSNFVSVSAPILIFGVLIFDMIYESVTGDFYVIPELQRTISVDIRYVLFVTDKFSGATHLIAEIGL